MINDDERFPEPPELKREGMPPLITELRFIVKAVTVIFIIILIISIYFYWINN